MELFFGKYLAIPNTVQSAPLYDNTWFILWREALINRQVRSLNLKIGSFEKLSLLPDHAVVKKVLVSERPKASNTKGTAESVDKEGISSSGLWPVKQTKPSYVKMKRLAIYGHIPKFTIWELITYDQHRLFVTTPQGTGLLPELCLFPPACCVHVVWLQDKHWELQTDSRSVSDNTVRQFWVYAITPICFLELLPQLGGHALLMRGLPLICKSYKHEKISREGWDCVWTAH